MKVVRTYYNISITGKCNRACPYCIVKDYLNKGEDLLWKEGLFTYLSYAKKGDLVEITGGEPTLVPWLEELISWLNDNGVYIVLRTNGHKLFENKYKWLVTVLNTHNEPEDYVQSRESLLKPTDVIIGKTVPYEHISDNNKGNGLQPPAATWEIEGSHPFNNSRHIDSKGNVWNMMCHPGHSFCTIRNDGNFIIDAEEVYEICGGCRHPIAAWTWAKKLGLENEVEESLKVSDEIELVYSKLVDAESRLLFETYYRFWECCLSNIKERKEVFLRGLLKTSSYTKSLFRFNEIYISEQDNNFRDFLLRIFPRDRIRGFIVDDCDSEVGQLYRNIPVIGVDQYLDQRNRKSKIIHRDFETVFDFIRLGFHEEDVLYIDKRQYFGLFKPKGNEVFVDCGSFDGWTAKVFLHWLDGKKGRVVSFDPARSDGVRSYKESHKLYGNCTFVEKAVYNTTGELVEFGNTSGEDGSDRVIEERRGQYQVETVRLDDYFKDQKVTFIKMDVEGSELKAIEGAFEILKRDKPKLAISIYHKKDDYYKIPKIILDAVPEYTFKIRHHSINTFETVLYGEVPGESA